MTGPVVYLRSPELRQRAHLLIDRTPDEWIVTVKPPTRTLDQNAKLWPMLADVSRQVEWHGTTLTPDEWKDVFTAALRRSKVVPGLDGGFVVLGQRTSTMSKALFSELVELIYAFGAERGVTWTDPAERKAS